MWWSRKSAPNGFFLRYEDGRVELSRLEENLNCSLLKDTVRIHSSSIVFLTETKSHKRMVLRIQRQLNMTNIIIVDQVGLAGGLCLFQNNDVQICQHNSTLFYVEIYIHELTTYYNYWYIFIYLSTDKATRRNQLLDLIDRSSIWGSPQIISRDFNNIIENFDKI